MIASSAYPSEFNNLGISGFSSVQNKLYRALNELNPDLARMYHGVLLVLADDKNPERFVFAAHGLRELMEKLPRYLGIPIRQPGGELVKAVSHLQDLWEKVKKERQNFLDQGFVGLIDPPLEEFLEEFERFYQDNSQYKQSRREEARSFFRSLELARYQLPECLEDRNLKVWNRIHRFFTDLSHHGKRSSNMEFCDYFHQLELLLLDKFYPKTFDDFDAIDQLIAIKPPELNATLKELIAKRRENYDYFFSSIDSVDWLIVLWDKGFFKNPPPSVRNGGYVSDPPWPESQLLARMAKRPEAEQLVQKIALDMPQTENHNVRSDVVEIALALPPSKSVNLEGRIKAWIEGSGWGLPTKIAKLALHFASGGEEEQISAKKLTRNILAVCKRPMGDYTDADLLFGYYPECQPLIDPYEYENILEDIIPGLANRLGAKVIIILRDILHDAMKICEDDSRQYYDTSHLWRPAIEEHKMNYDHSVRNALVNALRSVTERLIIGRAVSIEQAVSLLQEREEWPLFTRLILHLLTCFPKEAVNLVDKYLTNSNLFDNPIVYHEYVRLLQQAYNHLSSESKQLILTRIIEGPDLSAFRRHWIDVQGCEPSPETVTRYVHEWQRDYLYYINPHLPSNWKTYYHELLGDYGPPEYPELSYMEMIEGHISPLSREEVQTLSIDELLEYLKSWEPGEDWGSPSREGLARTLEVCVASNPDMITEYMNELEDIHPIYLEGIFAGLRNAARDGNLLNWFKIVKWPLLTRESNVMSTNEPIMKAIRRIVADLFCQGLGNRSVPIPFALRDDVWAILNALSLDQDPTEVYESTSSLDPLTLSINTVRGLAFHAIIAYAVWVYIHLNTNNSFQGFDSMPEVRTVLEKHLEFSNERCYCIRALYGKYYQTLFYIDKKWVLTHTNDIFPLDPRLRKYLDAAWEAFVVYSRPFTGAYDTLEKYYRVSMSRLTEDIQCSELSKSAKRLIEHVIGLYYQEAIGLGDDSVMDQLIFIPHHAVHAHAIDYLGRSLGKAKTPLSVKTIDRLKQLWTRWTIRAQETVGGVELSAFGYWVGSGKFDPEWSIVELKKALSLTKGRIEHIPGVLAFLGSIAHQYPKDVIECLSTMLGNEPKLSLYLSRQEQVFSILSTILKGSVSEAREQAEAFIHRLGAMGYRGFGELL